MKITEKAAVVISLKEKLSNYLLVAVLQAMLAVCRGINMTLGKDWY